MCLVSFLVLLFLAKDEATEKVENNEKENNNNRINTLIDREIEYVQTSSKHNQNGFRSFEYIFSEYNKWIAKQ